MGFGYMLRTYGGIAGLNPQYRLLWCYSVTGYLAGYSADSPTTSEQIAVQT